jgi:hypothetical protein
MPMSDRSGAYRVLARRLKGLRPHDFIDLLVPIASAAAEVRALDRLAAAAGEPGRARQFKVQAMQARADFERAVHHVVVEAISEADDGLIEELLGGDDRTLAQILLDA